MTEISPTDQFIVTGTGTIPDPATITTGTTDKEPYEGCLIKYENITITNDALGNGEWGNR